MNIVAKVLVVVGALNWGLVAVSENLNLVSMLLGSMPVLERLVYALVGLSAVWLIVVKAKSGKKEMPAAPETPSMDQQM